MLPFRLPLLAASALALAGCHSQQAVKPLPPPVVAVAPAPPALPVPVVLMPQPRPVHKMTAAEAAAASPYEQDGSGILKSSPPAQVYSPPAGMTPEEQQREEEAADAEARGRVRGVQRAYQPDDYQDVPAPTYGSDNSGSDN